MSFNSAIDIAVPEHTAQFGTADSSHLPAALTMKAKIADKVAEKEAKRVRKIAQNTEVDELALTMAQETYKMTHQPDKNKRGRKRTRDDIYLAESLEKIKEWDKELEQKRMKLEEYTGKEK